jgi:hypothetical protein
MNAELIKQKIKAKILAILNRFWEILITLYHPDNLKKRGIAHSTGLIALTVFTLIFLIGLWWNNSPSYFDVQAAAQERAEDHNEKLVSGYITTNTLIEVANTLLNKSGGYLSNDIIPPSVFMDDMPNWEWGVLQQVRDFSKALRNDISRARTQSEDPDLAKAEPKFNIDNKSWFWPTSEDKYQEGIELVKQYLHRLAARKNQTTQFIVGANNLSDWLEDVSKRLGNLSQRLSASVGQMRMNRQFVSEDNEGNQSPIEIEEKTAWTEIDNIFYEARGSSWALIHLLQAIEIDFKTVLERKNAIMTLKQVIRELKATQKMVWSPMILNGSEFGLFANHSLVLSSYIARAHTGIIELYELLKN